MNEDTSVRPVRQWLNKLDAELHTVSNAARYNHAIAAYLERLREWEAAHDQAEGEGTVTIDRDTYNTLVAAYKSYQQIGQTIGAMGETPKLRPEDIEALDQA